MMIFPLYSLFRDFKENYLEDFRNLKQAENINIVAYYKLLAEKYREVFNNAPLAKAEEFTESHINFLKSTFSEKRLFDFFINKNVKELKITRENAHSLVWQINDEMYHIFKYLDDEISRIPEPIVSTAMSSNSSNYNDEVIKNANAFFRGKVELVELLLHFYKNFHSSNLKTGDLTKFNQIFAYFNSYCFEIDKSRGNLDKKAYKNLVKELFGFDYGTSEIKGATPKHIEQLENLALLLKKR